jgi:hypothetical protein
MEVIVTDNGTYLDMSYFVKKLLQGIEVKEFALPGTKDSFVVDEMAQMLTENMRKVFHLTMAKLLYLAKWARPDILMVAFLLCTCVKSATMEDQKKLMRVLGYLKATQKANLLLRAAGVPAETEYVDVAYAIHNDSKSHSGVIVYVGQTLVYVSSRKQK